MESIGDNMQALIHLCVPVRLVNEIYEVIAFVGWNICSLLLVVFRILLAQNVLVEQVPIANRGVPGRSQLPDDMKLGITSLKLSQFFISRPTSLSRFSFSTEASSSRDFVSKLYFPKFYSVELQLKASAKRFSVPLICLISIS